MARPVLDIAVLTKGGKGESSPSEPEPVDDMEEDEDELEEEEPTAAKEAAAQELIDAVGSGDAHAAAEAFKTMYDICAAEKEY